MKQSMWATSSKIVLFLIITLSNPISAYAQTSGADTEFPAEKIISESVAKGESVDLNDYFENATDRVIRAKFLEDLLTEKDVALLKQGVVIANVRVEGPINLQGDILGNVEITNCLFTGAVNLQGAKFENLSFSSCEFREAVSLQNATIYGSLNFDYAILHGGIDFSFTSIGGDVNLRYSFFTNAETATFSGARIGNNTRINNAIFEGPVDFSYATINGILDFRETQFTSSSETSFNSVSVGSSAFFNNANFSGPVNFGHARINGNLEFHKAILGSDDEDKVSFTTMEVTGSLVFTDALFSGPAFFMYSRIGGRGDFSNSKFSRSITQFTFLDVEYGLVFLNSRFNGQFRFGNIDSNGPIDFSLAKFMNSREDVEFTSVNVQGNFSLNEATFSGPLRITSTNVRDAFVAEKLKFSSPRESITINQLEAQRISVDLVEIKNSVNFWNCYTQELYIRGPENQINLSVIDLSGTEIKRSLLISDFSVKDLVGVNLISFGTATIKNVEVHERADLSFTKFENLVFQNVVWPNSKGEVSLDGFVYQRITPGQGLNENNWVELLDLVNRSNYDVMLYRNLEAYLDEHGHSDWSDRVFIAQKRRERTDILPRFSPAWWWSSLLDGLTLYGREPSRAFIWSIFIIVFGAFVFRRDKMVWIGEGNEKYNPLWYSLDVFIPIELGFSNNWQPKPQETKVLSYKKIHPILGWIILPIVFLSISGFFK